MTELVLGGHSLLVPHAGQAPMWWGAFVMAPWTSLLREPLDNDGAIFAPHGDEAWHGVARNAHWSPVGAGLQTDLEWPFGGVAGVKAHIDGHSLQLELSVTAGDRPMSAALGWHPWFVRSIGDSEVEMVVADDTTVQERDSTGAPTGRWVSGSGGPWNHGVRTGPVQLRYARVGCLVIEWDAPWAILFTADPQGVCIEPTTSPAEQMDDVLPPHGRLQLSIRLTWTPS